MTDTKVPAFPNVLIIVTDAAVLVDGEVVDRGSAGDPDSSVAVLLGVHAAARRVAQRLGRPVRATLRADGEERRIIIDPDGSVTDAEEVGRSSTPTVSVAAPGARAVPVRRAARRPVRAVFLVDRTRLGTVAAYAALGAVLVGGLLVEASGGEDPQNAAATSSGEQAVEPPVVPQPVIDATQLERLPGISGVAADSDTGGFRLRVTTNRALQVRVLASPASGDGGSRLWTIRTSGATTRTLDIDDLEAGAYTWVVRSPGEPPRTGSVVVRPPPEPPVVEEPEQPDPPDDPAPTPDAPPPSTDDGGDDGGSGGDNGGGDVPNAGPTGPVDPDEPTAP